LNSSFNSVLLLDSLSFINLGFLFSLPLFLELGSSLLLGKSNGLGARWVGVHSVFHALCLFSQLSHVLGVFVLNNAL
jgi:hypothetical protein